MLGAVQEKLTVLEHVRLAVSALYSTLGQPDRSLFRCLFTGLLLLLILLIHADDNILGVQVGIGGAFVRPGFTVCTCSISSSCCRTFSAGGKIKQISFKPRASTVRCDTTEVPAHILCFCIIEIFCGMMKNVWTQNDVHPVTFGVKKKKKEHFRKRTCIKNGRGVMVGAALLLQDLDDLNPIECCGTTSKRRLMLQNLQCGWIKNIVQKRVEEDFSTAKWKTHYLVSERLIAVVAQPLM